MMKNATRKPRMIIVSGSARKISRRPPISGRPAIAPAAAAPMRACAQAVPSAPSPSANAAARASIPAPSPRAPAGAAGSSAAACAAPAITATASSANTDTLTTFRNLSTSCLLEWLVLTSGFVVILHFRQKLDPVETGGLNDVPDDGEGEEHRLADPGNQDRDDVPPNPAGFRRHLAQLVGGQGQRRGGDTEGQEPGVGEHVAQGGNRVAKPAR